MDVILYTVEGEDASDAFYSFNFEEASDYARDCKGVVIANEYEFSDSYMVDSCDYRREDDTTREECQ